MATIKSYTDLEQSKKLAKILPLESADMHWLNLPSIGDVAINNPYVKDNGATEGILPCWSLAALFSTLPLIDFIRPILIGTPKMLYKCIYKCIYNDDLKSHAYDNPIDACYEMILKLNELNLL